MALMRVQRFSMAGFGLTAAAAGRLRIPRMYGSARLLCVSIATDSQQDQAFVQWQDSTQGAAAVLGVRAPYYPDPYDSGDLFLAPTVIFNTVTPPNEPQYNTTGTGLSGPRSLVADFAKYNGSGSYLSVVAYYGSIPPALPARRDPLQLEPNVTIAVANAIVLRCITLGRDKVALSTVDPAFTLAGLSWAIFGCSESMYSVAGNRSRVALASGVGEFSEIVNDGFDAIEVEASDPAGAYITPIRLTAWDA